MTKRFLMIVAMLLWCSTGFAENINWNDMKKLHQKMDLKIGIKNHGNIVLSSKNKEFKNSDLAKRFLNYVNSYLDKRKECYEWGDLTMWEKYELKIEDPSAIKAVQCLQSYDRILIQSYGLRQLGSMVEARFSLLKNLPKDRSQTINNVIGEEIHIQINTFQEMERLVESTYLQSGEKPKAEAKKPEGIDYKTTLFNNELVLLYENKFRNILIFFKGGQVKWNTPDDPSNYTKYWYWRKIGNTGKVILEATKDPGTFVNLQINFENMTAKATADNGITLTTYTIISPKEPSQTQQVAKKSEIAKSKLSKEEVNKLKAEIKENGVIPYERGIVGDESEYALLIQEQHEFVKTEKAIILNDIDKSKKLCIEMGFSETTFLIFKNEKFSQCVLTTWKTELMGKKYAKMQKELNSQLDELKEKQIELDHVTSALNRTRDQQMAYTYEIEETQQSSSSGLESLIKGALGIAAGYYLGQAIGGSSGTVGQTSQGNTTILRGYRCTLHPTAFDC